MADPQTNTDTPQPAGSLPPTLITPPDGIRLITGLAPQTPSPSAATNPTPTLPPGYYDPIIANLGPQPPPSAARPQTNGTGLPTPPPGQQPATGAPTPLTPPAPEQQPTAPAHWRAVGDSIARGYQKFGGAGGTGVDLDPNNRTVDAAGGRPPSVVLDYLKSLPDGAWSGQNIRFSTGVSNNPGEINLVPEQLAQLKRLGAANVQVVGVGNQAGEEGGHQYNLAPYNTQIAQDAHNAGMTFTGGLPAVVHPAPDYYRRQMAGTQQANTGSTAGGSSVKQQVIDFWTSKGVPQHVAEGIAANVQIESGFNPLNLGDEGTSVGLYQAHEARAQDLQSRQGWPSVPVQNQWAWDQTHGGDPIATAHWNEIVNAPDAQTAGMLWRTYFERPARVNPMDIAAALNSPDYSMANNPAAQQYLAARQESVRTMEQASAAIAEQLKQLNAGSPEYNRLLEQQMQIEEQRLRKLDEIAAHPPTEKPVDVMGNFGSLATLIGIFGGMMARRPMVASLNAAGAAMEAINNRNHEDYLNAYKTWEKQSDLAQKAFDNEHTVYSDILANKRDDWNEKVKKLDLAFQMYNNLQGIEALKVGNFQEALELPGKMQEISTKYAENREKLIETNNKLAQEQELQEVLNADVEAYKQAYPNAAPADITRFRFEDESRLRQQITAGKADVKEPKAFDLVTADGKHTPISLQPGSRPGEFYRPETGERYTPPPGAQLLPTTPSAVAGNKGQPHSFKVTWPDGNSEVLTGWPGPPGSGQFTTLQGATRDLQGAAVVPLTSGAAISSQPSFSYPQEWPGMREGKPPPGIPEDVYQGAINYVKTGKMPALGMQSAQRNDINRAVPAAAHALGVNPLQMAEGWAKFQGYTSGQRALGTRAAALAVGTGEASAAAPAVITTSQKVGNSDFPPLNQFINLGSYLTGSPEIVQFRTALNTFMNTYARAINPQGHLTDSQQNHAYEILSTNMAQGQIQVGVAQLLQELGFMRNGLQDAVETVGKLLEPATGQAQPLPEGIPPGSTEIGTTNNGAHRIFLAPDGTLKEWYP